jgi:tryptophan synthase alpha chain
LTIQRIEARFAALRREGRAAFVAYVMAGDPDATTSLAILEGLPAAGADLIELGMPFSDPMADGPPIQRAGGRALAGGMSVDGALALAARLRETDTATPLILMGYLNPILSRGLHAFAAAAAAAGVDGLIAVDCPPEEAGPLADALDARDIALIGLAAPTTDAARLAVVARRARGFLYHVSVAGVTGSREADAGQIAPAVARARLAAGLPVAVGFGIRTPERAAEVARVADAVVVGSALVDCVEDAIAQNRDPVSKLLATAARLAQAVRSARLDES